MTPNTKRKMINFVKPISTEDNNNNNQQKSGESK